MLVNAGQWKRCECLSEAAIASVFVLPLSGIVYSLRFSQHGANRKAILNDASLHFDNRSPVDLKDR
jgi:hypothetical protein